MTIIWILVTTPAKDKAWMPTADARCFGLNGRVIKASISVMSRFSCKVLWAGKQQPCSKTLPARIGPLGNRFCSFCPARFCLLMQPLPYSCPSVHFLRGACGDGDSWWPPCTMSSPRSSCLCESVRKITVSRMFGRVRYLQKFCMLRCVSSLTLR